MLDGGHPGLQDGVIHTSEGEEARGCEARRAAMLDAEAGFHPKGIAERFKVSQCDERGRCWDSYGAGSLCAFQLLSWLQGTQT